MGIEIERKFLVKSSFFTEDVKFKAKIKQGYILNETDVYNTTGKSLRVRIIDGDGAYLTLKGSLHNGSRQEFEFRIDDEIAEILLKDMRSGDIIEKTRYYIPRKNHLWEVDVFEGLNKGLVIAEIELSNPDEEFEMPEWIGEEVTDDKRYYNNYLSVHHYSSWGKMESKKDRG